MTKEEYFKLIIRQKGLYMILGAAAALFGTHDGLRWISVVLFIFAFVAIERTNKKTEPFERALPPEPFNIEE